MALFCGGATFADTVIGNFDIAPGGGIVPSQGQVLFSLNANGTIGANLTVTNGEWIEIFSWSWGASNPVTIPPPVSSGKEGKADLSDITVSDVFGTQNATLICTLCETDLSWTIGNPGEFSSVLQAFNCTICETVGAAAAFEPAVASASSVDFVLEDTAGNFWGADAELAPTPEPGSLALLGMGVLGVAGMALRRRQFRSNTPPKTFVS